VTTTPAKSTTVIFTAGVGRNLVGTAAAGLVGVAVVALAF
jgi:hypothetical protein